MGRTERVIVALLVATTAAAFALIPRLISAPGGIPGGGLEPRPSRSVAPVLVIAGPPHGANVAHATQTPARAAAAPVLRVATPPASTPGAVHPPKLPPPSRSPNPPPPSNPPPPPTPPPPPPPTPASPPTGTQPGNGYGDKNHTHTGPPGHPASPSPLPASPPPPSPPPASTPTEPVHPGRGK